MRTGDKRENKLNAEDAGRKKAPAKYELGLVAFVELDAVHKFQNNRVIHECSEWIGKPVSLSPLGKILLLLYQEVDKLRQEVRGLKLQE